MEPDVHNQFQSKYHWSKHQIRLLTRMLSLQRLMVNLFLKKCSSSDATITFSNESSTTSNNASYKISWGDGTTDFTATTWDLTTHTYALGFWTMTYTITGSYGCSATKTYKVFVGSNPAGTLIPPGNTDICGDNTSNLSHFWNRK